MTEVDVILGREWVQKFCLQQWSRGWRLQQCSERKRSEAGKQALLHLSALLGLLCSQMLIQGKATDHQLRGGPAGAEEAGLGIEQGVHGHCKARVRDTRSHPLAAPADDHVLEQCSSVAWKVVCGPAVEICVRRCIEAQARKPSGCGKSRACRMDANSYVMKMRTRESEFHHAG